MSNKKTKGKKMKCTNKIRQFRATENELQQMLLLIKKEMRKQFLVNEVKELQDKNDHQYKEDIKLWIGIFNEVSIKVFNQEADLSKFEQFRQIIGIKPKNTYILSSDCPMRQGNNCRMQECPADCRKKKRSDYFD